MSFMSGRLTKATSLFSRLLPLLRLIYILGMHVSDIHLFQFCIMLSLSFHYLSRILFKNSSRVLIVTSIKVPSYHFSQTRFLLIMLLSIYIVMSGHLRYSHKTTPSIIWLLWITLPDTHGCIHCKENHKSKRFSWRLWPWSRIGSSAGLRPYIQTMGESILLCAPISPTKASQISQRLHILRSTMVSKRESTDT